MDRAHSEALLNHLWRRGTEFLGSRFAIMGGAMTWVSERHLVAAISNAGGFGVIASGSMPPEHPGDRDRRHLQSSPASPSAST